MICDELLPVLHKEYNYLEKSRPSRHRRREFWCDRGLHRCVAAPDHFRKVLSIVGSFTNLRGGHVYPEISPLQRKETAPRLLSGRPQRQPRRRPRRPYDPERDWFLQNVRLVEAMTEKGYDINYSWGIGLHGQNKAVRSCPK